MTTAIPILATIFVFILIKHFLDTRTEARAERMRLIEKAMESGQLGREMVEELAYGLAGRKDPRGRANLLASTILAIGWIGIFIGAAVCAGGAMMDTEEALVAGMVIALISFGVTTYPFALRELEARRQAQQ